MHVEFVKLQQWVVHKGLKVCILFEGRDGAGKGGTIKAMTERVSPRIFRVVALPAPTEREKSQMYAQRYIPHLPAAGEIVIFDRSWYNRAGVERVMGFCTEEEAKHFLEMVPAFEKVVVESGVILLKYWLEVSPDEQTRRLEGRIDDGRKTWKLSDMDLKSYSRWFDYSRARDEMFQASDTSWAPWYVVHSDNKRRARLNILTHILEQNPLRRPEALEGRAAETTASRRLQGDRLSFQVYSRGFLRTEGRQCSVRIKGDATAVAIRRPSVPRLAGSDQGSEFDGPADAPGMRLLCCWALGRTGDCDGARGRPDLGAGGSHRCRRAFA